MNDGPDRGFAAVEALLAHRHPKEDTAALGKTLRFRYVSPSALYESGAFALERAGLHPHDALLISVLSDIARLCRYEQYGKRPQLGRLPLAAKYLINTFRGIYVEQFVLLCLDARGKLTRQATISEGSEDAAVFDLRKLLEIVVETEPAAIVIAHNHPAASRRPSQEDLDCTEDTIDALDALGIPLLDHIIVAGPDPVSIRDNGFLPMEFWTEQNPSCKLNQNWLSTEKMPKSSLSEY